MAAVLLALLLPAAAGAALFLDLMPVMEKGSEYDIFASVENAQEAVDQSILDARYDGLNAVAFHPPAAAVAVVGGAAWVLDNGTVVARSPNATPDLEAEVLGAQAGNDTVVVVEDPKGFVVFAGEQPRMARFLPLDEVLAEVDGFEWVPDAENATGVVAPLRVAPGGLVAQSPAGSLLPWPVVGGGLLALALLISVGAGLLVHQRVVRPMRNVEACTKRLAAGEWACRAEEAGGPEAAVLARAFNDMAGTLQVREHELKRWAERLREDVEDLEYATDHHVREPLRSIATLTGHLLQDHGDNLSDDARHELRACRESALFVERLARDIGRVVDASTRPLRPEPVDVAAAHAAALERASIAGDTPLEVDGRPVLRMDRDALITLLQELLVNGLKFNENPTPRVLTRLRALDGGSVLEVEDNGIGLAADRFEEAVKPFRKLHRHETYAGTGVGLAVVDRLVRRHGGTLCVEARSDGGSRFHIRIPESSTSTLPAGADNEGRFF